MKLKSNNCFHSHRIYIVVWVVWVIFAVGCKKKSSITISTVAPELSQATFDQYLVAEESCINLPIMIDLNSLEKIVNSQTPQELYVMTNDVLRADFPQLTADNIRITRESNIDLSTVGDHIDMAMDIRIAGAVLANLGITTQSKSIDIRARISTATMLNIDNQWNIITTTTPNIEVTQPLQLNLLGFDLSFQRPTQQALSRVVNEISPYIDQEITRRIDLKQQVQLLWQQLAEPFMIAETPSPVWLSLQPISISYAPPKTVNANTLRLNINFKTKIATAVGQKPATLRTTTPPPPQQQNAFLDDDFEIKIPIVLNINEVEPELRKQVVGQTFDVPKTKKKVTVRTLDLSGSGNKMVAQIGVDGMLSGNLFAIGTPYYNEEKKSISIKDFNYSLDTDNQLQKKASWLLNKLFLRKIQNQLQYSIAEPLQQAEKLLEKSINDTDFGYGKLNADIEELLPVSIQINNDVLRIEVLAKGTLKASIQ